MSINQLLGNTSMSNETSIHWSVYGEHGEQFLVLLVLAMIPICFGNTLILLSLAKYGRLRTRSNILIGNIAIADLLVGTVLLPYEIVLLEAKTLNDKEMTCLVRSCLRVAILGAAVMSVLSMSVERFYAIVFPYRYVSYFTRKKIGTLAVTGWVVAVMLSMALFFFGHESSEYPAKFGCALVLKFSLWFRVLMNSIYISTILSCITMYVIVSIVACSSLKQKEVTQNLIRKHDIRKTRMMIVVFGFFSFCWLPYCIFIMAGSFIEDRTQLIIIENWVLCLAGFNSFINWIIYGLMNTDFRHAFLSVLRCRPLLTETGSTLNSKSSAIVRTNGKQNQ